MIPGSALAKSGSGTVTPAVWTALRTANSSTRERLDGIPVAASVRSTRSCRPASEPPAKTASIPQFSWIAPPDSRSKAVISTRSAPLASARKRDSGARSNGGNAVAAIDCDNRAGHIGARRRGQKKQRAVEIRRLRDPPQRNTVDQPLAGLALEVLAIKIGLDIAGRQRVDENAVTRQLHRQHMGQVNQARLRRAIRWHPADRARTQHRGDVDDPSRPLQLNQVMREFAGHQPGALQIGVDHIVAIRLGVLE